MTEWERILAVPRPKNTVVSDSNTKGVNRYAVRERNGTAKRADGTSYPVNGSVIGHIVNYQFIPVPSVPYALEQKRAFQYGDATIFRDLMTDVFEDLCKVFDLDDVVKIMVLAAFHLIYPNRTAYGIQTFYRQSWLHIYYPGAALSKNTRTKLYTDLGEKVGLRLAFNQLRVARIAAEHHIIIDSTLRQDTSIVNSYSEFSRKSRVRNCKDISIMYAYDADTMEPICGLVYPGNIVDATACRDFLIQNNILRGVLITDKGFSINNVRDLVKGRVELNFLCPLKSNDKRIANNKMTEYDGVLRNYPVSYKKVKLCTGNYLYSFNDPYILGDAVVKYTEKAREKRDYSYAEYIKKVTTGGLLVFESDLDLDPEKVYAIYKERWLLEMCFRQYKNDLEFDETDVQCDYAVIGDEFVKFVSTIAASRITNRGIDTGLLEEMTFADLIGDLSAAWRYADAPVSPVTWDEGWAHPMTIEQNVVLSKMLLATPDPDTAAEIRKRDAKRTKKESEGKGPKRKRAQLAKDAQAAEKQGTETQQANEPVAEKRGPGRPRKQVTEAKKKNPVGRPRKPAPRNKPPKNPVGRPRKNKTTQTA